VNTLSPGDVIRNTVCASPDPLFPEGSTICDSVDITVASDLSAQPLAFDVLAGGSVTVDASSDVSGGAQKDTDGNGTVDPYTYATGAGPANGTVSWTGTSFNYTNTSNVSGTDSFTITVTDGGLNATGQAAGQQATTNVTVNVIGVLAVANGTLTVDSGGQQTFDLEDLVTSGGKTPLQYSIESNGGKGTAGIGGSTLTYDANANSFGTDTVEILIEDSMAPTAQRQVATLNVTINPPALTAINATLAVNAGESASLDLSTLVTSTGIPPLAYRIDTDGDQGVSSLSGSTLTYSANADSFGTDDVLVLITDSLTPSEQVKLVVITMTVTPPALTLTDGTLIVDAGDSGSLDLSSLVTSPGITPLTYIVHDGTKGTATLTGTVMTYTAGTNSFGVDPVQVEVSDSVTPDAQTATLTVNVTIVPPEMSIDSTVLTFDVVEGQSVQGNLPLGVFGGVTPYTFTLVTGPAKGTLDLDPSGAFTYSANPGASGTDSFTFTVQDATEPKEASSAAVLTGEATFAIVAAAEPPTATATATMPGQIPTVVASPTATSESVNAVPTATATTVREIPPARSTSTATSIPEGNASGGVTTLPSTGVVAGTGQSQHLLLLGLLAMVALLLTGAVLTARTRRR
jgi:hypothetical protein